MDDMIIPIIIFTIIYLLLCKKFKKLSIFYWIRILFYKITNIPRNHKYKVDEVLAQGFDSPNFMKCYVKKQKSAGLKMTKEEIASLQKRIDNCEFSIFPKRAITILESLYDTNCDKEEDNDDCNK